MWDEIAYPFPNSKLQRLHHWSVGIDKILDWACDDTWLKWTRVSSKRGPRTLCEIIGSMIIRKKNEFGAGIIIQFALDNLIRFENLNHRVTVGVRNLPPLTGLAPVGWQSNIKLFIYLTIKTHSLREKICEFRGWYMSNQKCLNDLRNCLAWSLWQTVVFVCLRKEHNVGNFANWGPIFVKMDIQVWMWNAPRFGVYLVEKLTPTSATVINIVYKTY